MRLLLPLMMAAGPLAAQSGTDVGPVHPIRGSGESHHIGSGLRPSAATYSSPLLDLEPAREQTAASIPPLKRMSPTTKGLLIGGGVGLAASLLAVVLYVEGTDPGNYTGAGRVVLGATALGAVIGAAIGAGAEP